MGGESTQQQTQQSQTQPWDQAQGMLKGILGQLQGNLGNTGLTGAESGALNSVENNAAAGNPYANSIGGYASSLLNGGGANSQAGNVSQGFQDYGTALNGANGAASGNLAGYQASLAGLNGAAQGGLSQYQQQLMPYANGSMVGNNPALQAQLDTMRADITNQTNGAFAGAGRDFSGANSMALGRGISQGLAPVIAGQYNQDVANQMNAAGSLYGAGQSTGQFQAGNAGAGFGAGQSTGQFQAGNAGNIFNAGGQTAGQLSGMQQQYLANQGQGVQSSNDALSAQNYGANQTLAAEAQRRGIPVQALGLLANIGTPIAGLGSQSTGSSNTTSQMSGAQQFSTILQGIGSLIPKGPMSFKF